MNMNMNMNNMNNMNSIQPSNNNSRTVYLGNVPLNITAEELLNHIRSGVIESVKIMPEKMCAFISFLDSSSATLFHSDAILKRLTINNHDIRIGWGKNTPIPPAVTAAVQRDGATRNVYLGNLPEKITELEIRKDLEKFGPIDTIKIVREKSIGFVHFLSILSAIRAVQQLPLDSKWANKKIFYGKDRCAFITKTQQHNAAQYLGLAPGSEHLLATADREFISSALIQQSAAAAAIATSTGGANNLGNRTVYLGSLHPDSTIEEICNVVRGGLLQQIRYLSEKHVCFITFIDPIAAAQFYAMSNLHSLTIHNRKIKVGWGKHSGSLPHAIALAVTSGASRNIYIGNLKDCPIDFKPTEEQLRTDFSKFGDIEQINFLIEKNCAFINFTNISNAIKAIDGINENPNYINLKINFGKDRCGNIPRQFQPNRNNNNNKRQNQYNGNVYDNYDNEQNYNQFNNGLQYPDHDQQQIINNPPQVYSQQIQPVQETIREEEEEEDNETIQQQQEVSNVNNVVDEITKKNSNLTTTNSATSTTIKKSNSHSSISSVANSLIHSGSCSPTPATSRSSLSQSEWQ